MTQKRFNIRVYGICSIEDKFLITDEIINGFRMTKFVGGGVEWGEGIRDALMREFVEECGAEVIETKHFYTTEQFQESAFCSQDQLVSIYYHVKLKDPDLILSVKKPFEGLIDNQQCFRWVDKALLSQEDFTFPLDRLVVKKIGRIDYQNG